jgi:hypothetical protein
LDHPLLLLKLYLNNPHKCRNETFNKKPPTVKKSLLLYAKLLMISCMDAKSSYDLHFCYDFIDSNSMIPFYYFSLYLIAVKYFVLLTTLIHHLVYSEKTDLPESGLVLFTTHHPALIFNYDFVSPCLLSHC